MTISLAIIAIIGVGTLLTYYWFEFSDRVDRRLLSEEVFTPSAGIYSAPKTLRSGEAISMKELIDYLKTAGYIEKNNRADAGRSRYTVDAGSLLIEPGYTGVINGAKVFPVLSVKWTKDGKSVDSLQDVSNNASAVDRARLEPRMLSTRAAEGDGRRKTVTFQDIPPHLVKGHHALPKTARSSSTTASIFAVSRVRCGGVTKADEEQSARQPRRLVDHTAARQEPSSDQRANASEKSHRSVYVDHPRDASV